MENNIAVLENIRLAIIMTFICCYLERKKYKVFKFYTNNFSCFEITVPLLKAVLQ